MARMNIIMPAMGEGVIEATINKWLVAEGSRIKEDEPLVEVATDKVDSEIPSPTTGTLVSVLAPEGTVKKIGDIIAIIEDDVQPTTEVSEKVKKEVERIRETIDEIKEEKEEIEVLSGGMKSRTPSGKFLSPLVRSIVVREGLAYDDLDKIKGTGMDGRITKDDILKLLKKTQKSGKEPEIAKSAQEPKQEEELKTEPEFQKIASETKTESATLPEKRQEADEVIPMDRIRKIIAEHMVMSKRTSPHVTSFIDADVTKLVNWRNSFKDKFLKTEGQKLTLMPIFIDAVARALYEMPMINISVDGTNIIKRKNINIGMATALPDGNLIVPVIRNANEKNLTGLAKTVNDLADRARKNKLKPEEISGGTFTITNFGSYHNLAGTPIINQPQAAILGTGVVRKTPVVIETPEGDVIAIRQIMILSLSYDHRVIDGALAGKFLHKVKGILENYSPGIE